MSPQARLGRTLYAVINYGAPSGVCIAELDEGLRAGSVSHRITGEPFDLPTPPARHGCRLYVQQPERRAPGEAPVHRERDPRPDL
ncbi:hypothetical protein ACFYSJ_35460 [Streptomyces sp. NPDC005248]|uniref:hypothetical protein n=1 Tax=Streptomyces sp. NPDC005248 TaxID=3364709 RepID=UPI00368AEE33